MRPVEVGTENSGIQLQYTKAGMRLRVFGWYDHFVGIEGDERSLAQWCRELGIPPAHLRAAAKQLEDDHA